MPDKVLEEILKRSVEEKILIVEQLWDSIAEDALQEPLPEWKKTLLQERLTAHQQKPEEVKSWEEVKNKYRHK